LNKQKTNHDDDDDDVSDDGKLSSPLNCTD